MTTPEYDITITWDSVDEVFVAKVPRLPGCMAHGKSRNEALAQIEDAIQLWIETTEEFGDPVPEPEMHQNQNVW